MSIPVEGHIAPGFEAVADAFQSNFEAGLEVGAACAVYLDGELVVDIVGGYSDADTAKPWGSDTVAMVYSSTKGMASVCVHQLVDQGLVDLAAPVAAYWPAFGAEGKSDITIRQLLAHQAGLATIDAALDKKALLDGTSAVSALASQRPAWTPGSSGYHAMTYGWLVGELVRCVSGESIGKYFADQVAKPLGLSSWIGLPANEYGRVAKLVPPSPADAASAPAPDPALLPSLMAMMQAFGDPTSLTARAFTMNGQFMPGAGEEASEAEHRDFLGLELAAVNGVTSAASLARMYAACVSEVDGIRLFSDATARSALEVQSDGPDKIIHLPMRWGAGFVIGGGITSPMLGETSFGHPGSGGSIGFADLDRRVGFAYVMNKMGAGVMTDSRKRAMLSALEQLL